MSFLTARGNQLNFGWMINSTIVLHGGKTSEIRHNVFRDVPNENIVGHGVKVHHNTFDGLNGSAFHTSVHDMTKALNGHSQFRNNAVFNPNRIAKHLNGHSEGAVTFSWGAGDLWVMDNTFVSESGNFGVMGVFAGAAVHTDDNLYVANNASYNFESVITIVSPLATPVKNVLITNNAFNRSGGFRGSYVIGNTGIRLGCNVGVDERLIVVDASNAACH